MSRVVFMLEEYSMKVFLEGLLPRLFPQLPFLCVVHEGKNDLEKSLPRKLRAWRDPGVRFVVVRDNDGGDCLRIKARLVELCRGGGRTDAVVRIACQELEAWYLGDGEALALAFGDDHLRGVGERARYRDPDAVQRPSAALVRLAPGFQKTRGARLMGKHLSLERNRSHSFRVFCNSVGLLSPTPDLTSEE